MLWSSDPSIYRSTVPQIKWSNDLKIYRSTDVAIDRSTDLAIYRSTVLALYRSIDLLIYRSTDLQIHRFSRLQNSPYFCVFKYARAVKQKVWNEAENRERDWGETHTPYGRVTLARFARIRLLRHALPISLLILRKKPTVLQSIDLAIYRSIDLPIHQSRYLQIHWSSDLAIYRSIDLAIFRSTVLAIHRSTDPLI